MATTWNPLMSCSIDTETDNKVHSSEDYLENAIDYQADCDDLFHEGDDDSDNTLDYNTDGEDLHSEGEVNISGGAQRLPIFKQRSNASVHKFQVMLLDIIYKHKASLKMYDDICELVNDYSSSSDFDRHAKLQSRMSFLRSIEKTHCTQGLMPYHGTVQLLNDTSVTVPVFDTKQMIISMLTDPSLMNPTNFAEGYNVLTGDVADDHPSNHTYGEVHTGDSWYQAKNFYCKEKGTMPVGLIVFGDKSHTDLHGVLSLTPIIFTFTFFNREARNNPRFWRPFTYIPNLSYGKGTANQTPTKNKIQDEHTCISFAFKSLRKISEEGGFRLFVLGKEVHVNVWIHFFIGDTEGNNKWLGQYPGNKEGVQRPYRDCKCTWQMLSHINPNCEYLTLKDEWIAKKRKHSDDDGGKAYYKSMSKYDIKNSFTERHLPLSDRVHGPFKMMPPELLHTSGSGIIMYMFESLRQQLGGGNDRDIIDQLHIEMSNFIKRQSERDFPRGSMRNGLIDGTKCQSSERKGNLFCLLCICHTTKGRTVMKNSLQYTDIKWKDFLTCMKNYLAMEAWFHDSNCKDEVRNARNTIAVVLRSVQRFFPRSGKTNGYNIPKMHGMTKMQEYMKLFGSGMNFYGGPGEAAHKTFVKMAGQKTQRRVNEFAKQTANQYYYMMLTEIALQSCIAQSSQLTQWDDNFSSKTENSEQRGEDVNIILSGQYEIVLNKDVIEMMERDGSVLVAWSFDQAKKMGNKKFNLNQDLVRVIHKKLVETKNNTQIVIGYTKANFKLFANEQSIFYAHPFYKGHDWYDWAMVHFEEKDKFGNSFDSLYPSRLLGFISFNGVREAVVQCSLKPLSWDEVENNFIQEIQLGTDFDVSFVTVPLQSIVHPLCVLPDIGGSLQKHFVVLPSRNWSRFFGNQIISS